MVFGWIKKISLNDKQLQYFIKNGDKWTWYIFDVQEDKFELSDEEVWCLINIALRRHRDNRVFIEIRNDKMEIDVG